MFDILNTVRFLLIYISMAITWTLKYDRTTSKRHDQFPYKLYKKKCIYIHCANITLDWPLAIVMADELIQRAEEKQMTKDSTQTPATSNLARFVDMMLGYVTGLVTAT